MSEYQGKVVVITGASDGIGAALARELNNRGARLALVARTKLKLDTLAHELHDALAIVADVTDRAAVEHVLAVAMERFGQIDVWVNNVGRGITRPLLELSDDDVDAMITDNLKSALYGMQTIVPVFVAQGYGTLANVSSMLGRVPFAPQRSAYSASKAALNSLTETLRFTLTDESPDIRVVTVFPGVVATDFGNNALGGGVDSRSFPGAQTAEDAARVIADGLLSGPVDLYTRTDGYDLARGHLARLGGRTQ